MAATHLLATVLPTNRTRVDRQRRSAAITLALLMCLVLTIWADPLAGEAFAAVVAVAAGIRLRRWSAAALAVVAAALCDPALRAPVLQHPGAASLDTGWLVGMVLLPTIAWVVTGLRHDREALDHRLAAILRDHAARDQEVAEEREELSSQLEYWATHDALTGLANRTAFTRCVGSALAAGDSCGVLMVSLAGFTQVNSAFGPFVGDQVLTAIAQRLANALRAGDIVGRVGGDEFAVLLRGLQADNAYAAGDRLVALLADDITIDDEHIPVRARAGLAMAEAGEQLDALELLRRADVAVGSALPGSTVHVFARELQDAALERRNLEADLRRALANDEFFCVYQPLVSTTDGSIVSVEALVRWQHPTRGLVPPDDFISAAERIGLIVPLGLTVLGHACRQLRTWRDAGHSDLTMAVNLSARQIVEPGIAQSIGRILWRSGVDPRVVVLEITESLLLEDNEAALKTLWQLRGLGVRLALDDFGTGYSSLSRLDQLPIDEMKIDKSFIDRIGADSRDSSAIITGAVAMGHALGLTVVAEGVETDDQAMFLRDVKCDMLQGYLLGRPQSPESLAPRLGQSLWDATRVSRPRTPMQKRGESPLPQLMPAVTGR
jgi:diguanylate cyclase (GGDEF)-like protein